jgi:8-oxo-dGTP pyrophosphatase MutT (NUDIX family)
MRIRAVAILIENERIALIERHRLGRHYFTFPGGGVDEGETPEDAVVREMEEETGLRVAVLRKVAEVWFQGNRQDYFLLEKTGGTFGNGNGEEFHQTPMGVRLFGTYHPTWLAVDALLENEVLPMEMAERVMLAAIEGWPEEVLEIGETA